MGVKAEDLMLDQVTIHFLGYKMEEPKNLPSQNSCGCGSGRIRPHGWHNIWLWHLPPKWQAQQQQQPPLTASSHRPCHQLHRQLGFTGWPAALPSSTLYPGTVIRSVVMNTNPSAQAPHSEMAIAVLASQPGVQPSLLLQAEQLSGLENGPGGDRRCLCETLRG